MIYLIPVTLGAPNHDEVIPQPTFDIISRLRYFVVENIRTARRFLRSVDKNFPIDDAHFEELNEHSTIVDVERLLQPALKGNDIGVMSEAGLPCIADPGALLVAYAHTKGIKVKPMSGPSSIILALIASGFNGQQFTFNGYLPIKKDEQEKKLKELERLAQRGVTQIFMETPYRNNRMLDSILCTLSDSTLLSIAADITLNTESIKTLSVGEWKKNKPALEGRFVIFIVGRQFATHLL